MDWKGGKLSKVVIKSNLGGNLRLRTPNALTISQGAALTMASGSNPNPFYQVEPTPAPIVSEKAPAATPVLKETMLYNLPTQAGKLYTLVAQ